MKKLLVAVVLTGCFAALAQDGTWKYREGVGTSVADPALWNDPENWEDGKIPSGTTAVANLTAGARPNTVWIKLPDDESVVLGNLYFSKDNAYFRIFNGSFEFVGAANDTPKLKDIAGTGEGDTPDGTIVYSAIKTRTYSLSFDGVCLAGPVDVPSSTYADFYYPTSWIRLDLYAECGGEERPFMSGISVAQARHLNNFTSPKNCEATTGRWVATAGSKLLKYVSGDKQGLSLAVGAFVHADGVIKEGTFVQRLFSDTYIELSEPALASSADAETGTEIAFDRCYYRLTATLDELKVAGNDGIWSLDRRAAENVLALDIGKLTGSGIWSVRYSGHNYWSVGSTIDNFPGPGLVVLHDTSKFTGRLTMRSGHFRFSATNETGLAGVSGITFYNGGGGTYGQYAKGRLDTPAGVTATVHAVDIWPGFLDKVGDGTLIVKSALSTHNQLRVSNGTFVFDPSADDAKFTSVTVKDGGAFRLAAGRALTVATMVVEAGGTLVWTADASLTMENLALDAAGGAIIRVEEGATFDATGRTIPDGTVFEGPGAVTGLANAQIKACVFRDGVQVTPTGSAGNLGMTDTLSTELPTRISPAFWVSAKEPGTVIKGDAEHTGLVTQWNDVRGTPEQGYHFATNTIPGGFKVNDTTYAPYLKSSNSGTANASLIIMQKTSTAATNPGNSSALVWDAPIRGIKAVFAVVTGQYDGLNGGGSLLGSTERLSTCHFYRQYVGTCYNDRFSSTDSVCYNAPYYINGQLPPDGQTLGGSVRPCPMLAGNFVQVVDVHPLGDGAEADCWGYQRTDPGAYGAWIGECLIYTNAVTEIERRHIENYLMQKWLGSKVVAADIVPDDQDLTTASLGGATLNVGAGDAVAFDSFTDEAGLTKSGAGAVYVKCLQTTGAFTVRGGTVNLTSCDATKAAVVPAGALIHVDANDDESFPGAVTVEGGQKVKTWTDTDNPSNVLSLQQPSAAYTTLPVRKTDESSFVQPMKVVDYGAFHCDKDEDWTKDASGWWGSADRTVTHTLKNGTAITNATGVTSVFAVWGTAAGGNQLLGGWDQRGDGFSRLYGVSSDVAGNIAKPILNTCDNNGNADPFRTSARSALNCAALSFMNGNEIVLDSTAPSGAYDVISFITPYATSFSSLACISIRNKAGGMQMGELIAYTKMLTSDEARMVDAYLNWKWFGRTPPAKFRPAHVGALRVDAGATLKVEGNAPLTVASLASGGGTVDGDIAFASAPELTAVVNSNGSIDPVTVSGSLDVSAGGTVRLGGATEALAVGTYELVLSDSIAAGAGAWAVDLSSLSEHLLKKFVISASAQAGKVVLTVSKHGLLLMVR